MTVYLWCKGREGREGGGEGRGDDKWWYTLGQQFIGHHTRQQVSRAGLTNSLGSFLAWAASALLSVGR